MPVFVPAPSVTAAPSSAPGVALAGVLDAAVVGRAALAGAEDPQDLKKVWHCVAALGDPMETG